MNRPANSTFILPFLLALCIPVIASCRNAPPSTRAAVTPERFPDGATPTALPDEMRIVLHSGNLSLIVEDPVEALTVLQQAVEQAGGHVASASSWSSPGSPAYSSLSAKVPPESLSALRRAAIEIAEEVQSDNLYSTDVTSEYRLLHKRLQELTQAQDDVWRLLIRTDDPELASTFTFLRTLLQTEKSSVESQISYYDRQAELASFDVTLNQPSYFLAPIE